MQKINLGRVFVGGMAAGALAIFIEYLAFAFGAFDQLAAATGLPLNQPTAAAQVSVAALQLFVGGPLAIWLYAAIRPRFGAGPRTALLAAVYIWIVLMPYGFTVLHITGLLAPLPVSLLVVLDITSLVHISAAMLVGAWVYREDAEPAARAAGASG